MTSDERAVDMKKTDVGFLESVQIFVDSNIRLIKVFFYRSGVVKLEANIRISVQQFIKTLLKFEN